MKYEEIISLVKRRFPNEPEYLQAVEEVIESIEEVYNQHPEFEKANLVERLIIPDKIHTFRVTWVDDKGNVQTNMDLKDMGASQNQKDCPHIDGFLW